MIKKEKIRIIVRMSLESTTVSKNRNRKQSSYHVLVVTPIEEKRKKINKYIRLDKTKAMFSSYN